MYFLLLKTNKKHCFLGLILKKQPRIPRKFHPDLDPVRLDETNLLQSSPSPGLEDNPIHAAHMRKRKKEKARVKKIFCTQCFKGFISLSKYDQHLRIHTNERPFTCTQCGKQFIQKQHLRTHISMVHNKEKFFTCNVCLISFSTKSSLQRHLQIHFGEKSYPCNECSSKFKRKEHLRKHMMIHSGERPIDCEKCNKKFRDKSDLARHTKTHMNPN